MEKKEKIKLQYKYYIPFVVVLICRMIAEVYFNVNNFTLEARADIEYYLLVLLNICFVYLSIGAYKNAVANKRKYPWVILVVAAWLLFGVFSRFIF